MILLRAFARLRDRQGPSRLCMRRCCSLRLLDEDLALLWLALVVARRNGPPDQAKRGHRERDLAVMSACQSFVNGRGCY